MASELRELIALMPMHQRGASAISKALGLDRATCQRAIAAAATHSPDARLLVRMPGVEGLRRLAERFRAAFTDDCSAEIIDSVLASIFEFESMLEDLGGSQRQLAARLDAESSPRPHRSELPLDDARLREEHFRTAASLAGRWCRTCLHIRAIVPSPKSDGTFVSMRIRGFLGLESTPAAPPLEVGEKSIISSDLTLAPLTLDDRRLSGNTTGLFLEDFCSKPLPTVITRNGSHSVLHYLDIRNASQRKLDLVLAGQSGTIKPFSRNDSGKATEIWWLQQIPARLLVFDLWIHRGLGDPISAQLTQHIWTPDLGSVAMHRWSNQVPGGPGMEELASINALGSIAAYPRMRELFDLVMKPNSMNFKDFRCYRCQVTFPVWRIGFCVSLRFADNSEQGYAREILPELKPK